jgi:hypothetical protein
MKMAQKKTVKMMVSVFDIQPISEGMAKFDMPLHLYNSLNSTQAAKERLMPLSNDENNKDSDFISNFVYGQKYLFGSFVRLNAGEESTVLLASLDKKTVQINDMITAAQKDSAGSIHESVFFCMYENTLVMNLARTNRRPLEVYTNWFLRENNNEDQQCKFSPLKNQAATIPIKEIQSIQFADSYINGKQSIKNESLKIKKELLKSLLNDIKSLRDFEMEDIISATLLIKINKRELKKNNSAALDTALRLLDRDDIVITGKNGKRIRGTEYFCKKLIEFERTSTVFYNEKAIETEMRNIIRAVKIGEVVA